MKVTQLCLTVCNPIDYTVHGIFQARILEWVAFLFSRGSSQPRDQTQVSCIGSGFFTTWATREAQEYWSGYPIPSPEDLPNPGIKQGSPVLQADPLPTEVKWSEVTLLSRVRLFATLWSVAHQVPLSMGFSRQEYWSGLPFPSPGDLPDPGIKPQSPALEADALTSESPGKPLTNWPSFSLLVWGVVDSKLSPTL